MRDLAVDDVFTVANIAVKVYSHPSGVVLGLGELDHGSLALSFFTGMMSESGEIKAWLADLQGISVEEFSAMPPTALLDVIEELAERKDIKDFFERAVRLGQKLMQSST